MGGAIVVSAWCAVVILLAEGAILYFPEKVAVAPLQFLVLTASFIILLNFVYRRYRGIKHYSRLDRYKEENERLSSQLNHVLIERKEAERKISELREALEHEKTRAARAVTQPVPGDGALTLLAMLQTKGRFVDFLMEDIAVFDDSKVAAAARFVHQGCKNVLQEHAQIAPLESREEGEELTLEQSYDPSRIKVVGTIRSMPCKGVLLHRGWKANYLKLPQAIVDRKAEELIISPAEVEVK